MGKFPNIFRRVESHRSLIALYVVVRGLFFIYSLFECLFALGKMLKPTLVNQIIIESKVIVVPCYCKILGKALLCICYLQLY